MSPPAIGVTGSIGTGKSTFSEFLAEDGGKHLDADTIAKDLMKPGHRGYQPVVDEFGTAITDEEGHIQASALAEDVFSDPERLERLESILHPLVIERLREEISTARHNFYVIDAPLLFEAGVDELCDWTIAVTAPEEDVAERIASRGMSEDDVERRRSRQLSQSEKKKRADEIVENDGSLEELRDRAVAVRRRILDRDFQ